MPIVETGTEQLGRSPDRKKIRKWLRAIWAAIKAVVGIIEEGKQDK